MNSNSDKYWIERFAPLRWLFIMRKLYLINTRWSINAQFGEDLIIPRFLDVSKPGFYVDVGCFHPRKYSNTHALYKRGWRGINVDVDEIKIELFRHARPEDHNVCAAVTDKPGKVKFYSFGLFSPISTIDPGAAERRMIYSRRKKREQEVDGRRLDDIIAASPYHDREIDLLTVDAEDADLEVMRSLSFERYKPKLVLCETYARNHQQFADDEMFRFFSDRGYVLVNWTGLTMFFQRKA